MTRDEEREEAKRLLDEGLTLQEVAERLGYRNHASAWRLLHPAEAKADTARDNARRRDAKRAWENEHDRGTCPCGTPLVVGSRRRGTKVCRECHDEMVAVGTAMKRERIAELWAQGLKLREIAAVLGTTQHTITVDMTRMRRDGWDLPRRHNWSPEGLERAQNARRAV